MRRQAIFAWLQAAVLMTGINSKAADATSARPPKIFPDYEGIVIPPNIAPLNFVVEEPGTAYRVKIHSKAGPPIEHSGRSPRVIIPLNAWKTLLQLNGGQTLSFDIAVKTATGAWQEFAPLTNTIAKDNLDPYLAYRLLKPLYNTYAHLGIYQRNLETSEETEVLKNDRFNGGCLNCHTFLRHSPETMAFHVRGAGSGNPMILVRSNEAVKVAATAGYLSWHPSGRLIAYSANKLSLFFHTVGETRDVFDAESNLGIYRVDSNRVVLPANIAKPDRQETWPGWSPDGRHLYFCSAPKLPQERFREVRYDLMRIGYNIETDQWGEPETLVSAAATGLSAAQPKVSPDGKYLLFCLFKHGNFPIYQASSDLYLLDLKTLKFRRLEINSDQADSWHCWSSNSRWVVFSSKRRDGLFARPYFSHVDEAGQFSKPFLLPQKDPAFYDSFIKTYNVPEFVQGPIRLSPQQLAEAIVKPRKVLRPPPIGSQVQKQEVEYERPKPRN